MQHAVTHSLTHNYPANIHLHVAQDTRAEIEVSKPRLLVDLLCLVQWWITFRLAFKGALKSQRAEVVQCEVVCEMHTVQLLLAVIFAKRRPLTLLLGVAIFNISGI